jgi:hypothetical protein
MRKKESLHQSIADQITKSKGAHPTMWNVVHGVTTAPKSPAPTPWERRTPMRPKPSTPHRRGRS